MFNIVLEKLMISGYNILEYMNKYSYKEVAT